MGKSSRLRMLGEKYLNRLKSLKNVKKEVEERLKNISDSATYEAKINSNNFISWWKNAYEQEYKEIELELRLNKNKKRNTVITLKRMKEWKNSLRYS